MLDEYIKEITIALIEKGFLYCDGDNNEEVAKNIAKFINTLRKELEESL